MYCAWVGRRGGSGRQIRPAISRLCRCDLRYGGRRGEPRAAQVDVDPAHRRVRMYNPARLHRHAFVAHRAVRPAARRRIGMLDRRIAAAAGVATAGEGSGRGCHRGGGRERRATGKQGTPDPVFARARPGHATYLDLTPSLRSPDGRRHGGGVFEVEELRRGPTIPAGRRGSSAARLPGPIPGQQGRHRNYCATCWRWYSLRFMSR